MTLYELIKHLRISILDDTGGTNVSWGQINEGDDTSALLRWSNEELTAFINEAQRQACRAALLLKRADPAFDISVIAEVSDYDLDPIIINVKNVFLESNGTELVRVEIEDLYSMPRWREVTGTPNRYIVDYNMNTIRLYPTPVRDDTLNLIVYSLPSTEMSWLSADFDEPEIKQQFQLDMLYHAAYMAYMKENANTFDPQRSEKFKLLFDSEFSNTNAYIDVRRERTRHRPIKYGGY
jgi:hypothetical protein